MRNNPKENKMKSVSVLYMSMSLDGYIAGPNDEPGNPGGDGFMRLHEWGLTPDGGPPDRRTSQTIERRIQRDRRGVVGTASATVLHLSRGEIGSAMSAAVFFVLVTLVAYMRWKVKPIAARQMA